MLFCKPLLQGNNLCVCAWCVVEWKFRKSLQNGGIDVIVARFCYDYHSLYWQSAHFLYTFCLNYNFPHSTAVILKCISEAAQPRFHSLKLLLSSVQMKSTLDDADLFQTRSRSVRLRRNVCAGGTASFLQGSSWSVLALLLADWPTEDDFTAEKHTDPLVLFTVWENGITPYSDHLPNF